MIALILHSCWRLAKLGMEDWLQWVIAAVCFVVTVALQAEVAILFIAAGIIGILYYGSLFRARRPLGAAASALPAPWPSPRRGAAPLPLLGKLLVFFLKAGSLTFGSGLVIVPFLEKGLCRNTDGSSRARFLVAVAIGMMSPGPVVITATFVGYLVAGFWGSLVSTIGDIPAVLHAGADRGADPGTASRQPRTCRASSKAPMPPRSGRSSAPASCSASIAIGDWLDGADCAGVLGILFRWKVSNPLLVGATAVVGLIAFPLASADLGDGEVGGCERVHRIFRLGSARR